MNKMKCEIMSVLCNLMWTIVIVASFAEANPTPGLKIQCTEAGFFARPGSCKQYYRCVDWFKDRTRFSIYHFTCPAGTVFDDAMDVCSNPDEVQPPVMCMGDEAESPPADPEPDDYDTSDYFEETNSNPEPDSQPEPPGVTFPPLPPGEKLSCTEEGFFPYPGACSSFYRCVDLYGNGKEFNLYLFHCGPGTVFHPGYDICNHPAAVPPPCGNAISEGEGPPQDKTSPTSNVRPQTTKPPSPTEPVSISSTSVEPTTEPSLRCTKAGFFGYPNSCKIFYRCVDLYGDESKFNIYFFKCPTSTVFHEDNSTCDFPYNVPPPCGSMIPGESHTAGTITSASREESSPKPGVTQPSSQQPSSVTTTSETTTSSQSSGSSSTKETYLPPPRVPFDCKNKGFFPYPDSCTKYIQCVDYYGTGEKYATFFFSCAPGTVFDSTRRICDHKYNVEPPCGTGPSSHLTLTITESTTVTATETTIVNTDSTSETTTKTITSETTTPAATTTNLTPSSIDPPTDSPVCTQPGFFAYAESCKTFYRCVNMTEDWKSFNIYFFQCPRGTGFDNDLETCNHIAQVPDCKDTTDPPVTSTLPISSSDTTEDQGRQTPVTQTATETTTAGVETTTVTLPTVTDYTTTSTVTTFEPKDLVSCTEPGYFPYPGSCTKFYRCVNETRDANKWAVYYFQCSNDTVFDPATSICNYRQQVNGMLECEMTTVTGPTSTVTLGTDIPNPECKEAGFFVLPESCTKFYRCVDWFGDGSEFSIFFFDCPAGTVFDDGIDTCVPPHRIDSSHPCGEGLSFPTDSTPPTDTTITATDTATTTGGDTTFSSATVTSAKLTQEPTYLRVPGHCHKYHAVLECDQGLIFQESTQSCLPADEADPCDTDTTTVAVTETTTVTQEPSKIYTVVEGSLYGCPAPGFYPYEHDCIRFYRCVEEEPGSLRGLLYRCPEGYQYSDETKFCAKEEDTPECTKEEGLEHRVPIDSVLHAPIIQVDQLRDFFNPKNLRPYIYEK